MEERQDLISRQAAIDTEGLDEQIRCEMCRNPLHTDRGCDGNCKYDEKLYERIMQILGERIKPLPSAQPEQRWILCVDGNEPKANADCWISTNAKYVRRASYAPKANTQPNGFIVTEGGFGFYEYGKSEEYPVTWFFP